MPGSPSDVVQSVSSSLLDAGTSVLGVVVSAVLGVGFYLRNERVATAKAAASVAASGTEKVSSEVFAAQLTALSELAAAKSLEVNTLEKQITALTKENTQLDGVLDTTARRLRLIKMCDECRLEYGEALREIEELLKRKDRSDKQPEEVK